MDNKDKPAFSVALYDNGNALHKEAMGLSKREYFAVMAMQGLLASGKVFTAKTWVRCADELLKELETK